MAITYTFYIVNESGQRILITMPNSSLPVVVPFNGDAEVFRQIIAMKELPASTILEAVAGEEGRMNYRYQNGEVYNMLPGQMYNFNTAIHAPTSVRRDGRTRDIAQMTTSSFDQTGGLWRPTPRPDGGPVPT